MYQATGCVLMERMESRRSRMLWLLACVGAILATAHAVWIVTHGLVGVDSHAYWLAAQSEHPYGVLPGRTDGYFYSPVFAQLLGPVAALPWPVFAGLWLAIEAACFWWVTGGLAWQWRSPLLGLALPEVVYGNINGLVIVVLVCGFRRPALWALPLLTKVATAIPGLLWFAVRGEWGKVARVAVVSGAVAGASFAVDPELWAEWFDFLRANGGGTATWVRLAVAVPLVVWAARTGRGGWLPLAVLVLTPTWWGGIKDFAILVAAHRAAASGQSLDAAAVPPAEQRGGLDGGAVEPALERRSLPN